MFSFMVSDLIKYLSQAEECDRRIQEAIRLVRMNMKSKYNFSKMKGRKNPYAQKLKRLDIIAYFKAMADDLGVPYQQLINLYLRDCVQSHRTLRWGA